MSTRLCVERSISLNRNVTGPEGTGVTGALSTKGVSLPETLWGPKPYPRCDLLHIARSRALPVDRGRSRALRALRPPNPPRKQLRDCFPTSARERATADHGQATIEAALTLPVVLIALLLIVQVGLVVRDALALVQAAREGARAAAVSGNDDDARAAIRKSAACRIAAQVDVDAVPK